MAAGCESRSSGPSIVFIGFYLTLPRRRRAAATNATAVDPSLQTDIRGYWQRWQPAWGVRWRGGSTRLNFDLHRAFGLWAWLVLFTIAFTAFSLESLS